MKAKTKKLITWMELHLSAIDAYKRYCSKFKTPNPYTTFIKR